MLNLDILQSFIKILGFILLFINSTIAQTSTNKDIIQMFAGKRFDGKVMVKNKAVHFPRSFFHPRKATPGYYDCYMRWHSLDKEIASIRELQQLNPQAMILFNDSSLKATYIDAKAIAYILTTYPKWTIEDLSLMFDLGLGTITLDEQCRPWIQIGSKKISYPLPKWQTNKLCDVLSLLMEKHNNYIFSQDFSNFIDKVISQRRQYLYESMDREKFFYSIQAINSYYLFTQNLKINIDDLPMLKTDLNKDPAFAFSLVPFKRADLDMVSANYIRSGVNKGFTKIALFFPIHYSGGSTEKYRLKRINGQIVYGKHYFYEDLMAVDGEELARCLDKIFTVGLSLTFVPHLENINTMNRQGEKNWRIHAEIPLDEHYFAQAYTGLFAAIHRNRDKIQPQQQIRIIVASEVDPAFLTEAKASYRLIQLLEQAIAKSGIPRQQVKLVWNPNGDFYHGWHSQQNKPDIKVLLNLFSHIDAIGPSMYEEYQHIENGDWDKSKERFYNHLKAMVYRLVSKEDAPLLMKRLEKIVKQDFSIGEFALKDNNSKTDYYKFHHQFKHHNPTGTIVFWNMGNWDHANITGHNKSHHENDIARVLSRR